MLARGLPAQPLAPDAPGSGSQPVVAATVRFAPSLVCESTLTGRVARSYGDAMEVPSTTERLQVVYESEPLERGCSGGVAGCFFAGAAREASADVTGRRCAGARLLPGDQAAVFGGDGAGAAGEPVARACGAASAVSGAAGDMRRGGRLNAGTALTRSGRLPQSSVSSSATARELRVAREVGL